MIVFILSCCKQFLVSDNSCPEHGRTFYRKCVQDSKLENKWEKYIVYITEDNFSVIFNQTPTRR
uniref:Uncharacterized protein n=1 Tax=Arion vulgaris TaxID=1028688 RepID=A0A0B7ACA6_9EUPU